jgi:hypothetical protein
MTLGDGKEVAKTKSESSHSLICTRNIGLLNRTFIFIVTYIGDSNTIPS